MFNKLALQTLVIGVIFTLTSQNALSITNQEQGLIISQESKSRDIGWVDYSADMTMYLRNKQQQESVREVNIKSFELESDGDKSLTLFKKPRDVQGTAFLSFSHPVDADDQWLYLPALKRVKRISSRNKSGPFMGSEFAFEDLSSFEIEKYTYNYLDDDSINGMQSFMVEQYPVDSNSGYTRRIVWIDKEQYRVQKIEFYDRKNSLLKTLTYTNYKQYLGQYWRADRMNMLNHQNGKSTELQWANYAFRTGLKEADFNKNALKRAR